MPGAGAWLEGVLERWDSRRGGAEGPAGPPRLLPEMSPGKLFGLLVLLVTAVSILATSFVSVEYYQIGLRKTKSTGRVQKGRVYGPGRYAHGPDSTFKRFPADYHLEQFGCWQCGANGQISHEDMLLDADGHLLFGGAHEGEEGKAKSGPLSVFSGDKLESLIKIAVVYKINEKKLQELHDTYEFGYRDVLRGKVIDAIKNTAPEFQTPFFFQNRTFISTRLSAAVNDRIVNPETGFDRQLDLIDVYFGQVEVPSEVSSKQLASAIQLEENERAIHLTNSRLIRKETDKLVDEINNNATVIVAKAEAEANFMRAAAEADAFKTIEDARNEGLAELYAALNMTDAKHKASFDYLRMLLNHKDAKLRVGYSPLITAPAP